MAVGHTPKENAELIGMVHALALPGAPAHRHSMSEIRAHALEDARRLLAGGCDRLLIENMHDTPYVKGTVAPETVAAMALVVSDVVALGAPVGIQLLAGANRQALGIAVAAGASFLRVEGFAFAHVADEGWMDACAGELLRARRALGSSVTLHADIMKKHAAHAVTADLSLSDWAEAAAFCGADGVVVTGKHTGHPTDLQDVVSAKRAGIPVWVGSGVTPANAGPLAEVAAALIVGSYLKEDGDWRRPVDEARVRAVALAMGR